jgi:hypothetical protein
MRNQSVLQALDGKIAEAEKELIRHRRLADRIPQLEEDLQSLRRTRAMFNGSKRSHDSVVAETPPSIGDRRHERPPTSIGSVATAILREADRPMHVDELLPKLREKGKDTSRGSLVSTLIRYTQEGILTKPGMNTFALKQSNKE